MKKETLKLYEQEVNVRCSQTPGIVPAQRRAYKQGYSFSTLPAEEQILIWDHIWKHASAFWPRAHAFFYCETLLKNEETMLTIWPVIVTWQEQVNSWELSDSLSKIYSRVLELKTDMVYPILKEWNSSHDPWERRQSLVSLLYYSSTRKKVLPFKKLISQVANLITDQEYYVQKGVAWTLREIMNVYPDETMKFLQKHIHTLSPIAFSTATEKISLEQKNELKAMRKKKKN